MPIIDFEDRVMVRIKRDVLEEIDRVIRKRTDIYMNRSHFVRCACAKLVREEDHREEFEKAQRRARFVKKAGATDQ